MTMQVEISSKSVLSVTRSRLVDAYLSERRKFDDASQVRRRGETLKSYLDIEEGYLSIEDGSVVFHYLTYADPEFSETLDHWVFTTMMVAGELEERFVTASRFALSPEIEAFLDDRGGVFKEGVNPRGSA